MNKHIATLIPEYKLGLHRKKKEWGKKQNMYLVLQFKCRISSVWRHTCHDKRQQVFGPQNAMWSKSQFYIQLLYKQKIENMNSIVWAIGKLVSILLFGVIISCFRRQ